ncbi:MAG: sensor histidine kinase [Saprospiraceae bacterium]
MIQKNKRSLVIIGLLLFASIGGVIMMALDLEITGSLFLLGGTCMVIYLFSFWLLKKKNLLPNNQSWLTKETWIASISVGILALSGAFESFTRFPELALVYILILLLVGRIGYLDFRNNKRKFPLWLLGICLGIMFIALNDLFDEEFFVITFFIYLSIFSFLIARWIFRQIRIIIQLKNEKAKTELLHLKSQVNPHFFFNMLNNLYGLVNKDSKKAQALILKLSDMMRYSIYEGQKEMVTLEEEIEYLKNYVELHQMRYHKKIDIEFDRDIHKEGIKVMPLLFIILLENAFKHGVENLRKDAYVYLDLTTTENEIQFRIENNFDLNEVNEEGGIGLKNLKRRLELVYPNQHALLISETADVYKVQLSLQQL